MVRSASFLVIIQVSVSFESLPTKSDMDIVYWTISNRHPTVSGIVQRLKIFGFRFLVAEVYFATHLLDNSGAPHIDSLLIRDKDHRE